MCVAIRFSRFEFSDKQLSAAGFDMSGDEVRVSIRSKNALLPVHYRGNNLLMNWGNKIFEGVPKTGYCRIESLESGKWQWLKPEKAVVLASAALVNGVWFQVRQGIDAVIIRDPRGGYGGHGGYGGDGYVGNHDSGFFCYPLTKPSTHYFRIMTGSLRMPVLVNQVV